MSTDENKNSGNNTNTAQDINPVIRKNRFQPNSRYFTIVIYGLMFVLGTILLVRIVGSFNNTVKLLGQALQVIAIPCRCIYSIYTVPSCQIFLQKSVQEYTSYEIRQAFQVVINTCNLCYCYRCYCNTYGIHTSTVVYEYNRYRGQTACLVQQPDYDGR